MGEVKKFLKWLADDTKREWLRNWPDRKQTLIHMGSGAKFVLVMLSWLLLVMGLLITVVNLMMDVPVAWGGLFELVFGVFLLNGLFFINKKLDAYKNSK